MSPCPQDWLASAVTDGHVTQQKSICVDSQCTVPGRSQPLPTVNPKTVVAVKGYGLQSQSGDSSVERKESHIASRQMRSEPSSSIFVHMNQAYET